MYSKQERAHYVMRMWEEGLRPSSAHDRWGTPSKAALFKWERDALAGRLEVGPVRVPHRCEHVKFARYPQETKDEALRLVRLGKPTAEVARMLGLPGGSVVGAWVRKARLRATMGPEAVEMSRSKKAAPEVPDAGLVERLRMENAVLREMLSDPKAGDPARLSNRQKAELGERLRRDCGYPLLKILTYLRISKSSYEYERRALARPARPDGGLPGRVARAFAFLKGRCGYRKVAAVIRAGADGEPPAPAPERRVRAAMREGRMRPRRGRREPSWSSYGGEPDERPANAPLERARARRAAGEDFRLAHDFSAAAPGELLVTDVTEFSLNGYKLYMSPVIDCWDGCPVGLSVSAHPDQELCSSSLDAALSLGPAAPGRTVHTDGGSCYRTARWKAQCRAAGAARSMSRKGTCPDNARAEGFFGTLKQEFLYGREWAGVGPERFAAELVGYVAWYVCGRPRAFREPGGTVYMTLAEHRRLNGAPVPVFGG